MKEKTKYWVSADLHLGHDKMIEIAGRPNNFEHTIIDAHRDLIRHEDIFICLGDVCIGDDLLWNCSLLFELDCKKWLIRGNHDRKTDSWYLDHGWDFVAESVLLNRYGFRILLSHKPEPYVDNNFDINVHGHLHGDSHRHGEFDSIVSDRHRLIAMEHSYSPSNLRSVVGK